MSVWRAIFGSSRAEIWRKLADEVGGRYVEGGFFASDKVIVHSGEWTLTLDTFVVSTGKSAVTYTRMRAPYINRDGFRFDLHRKNVFSHLGELLGLKGMHLGIPAIDEQFVVHASDRQKMITLVADERVRQLLAAQPAIRLEVKDDEGWFGAQFPEGVDELRFQVTGVINDIGTLEALFELFAEVLDRLCLMGSAYQGETGVVF